MSSREKLDEDRLKFLVRAFEVGDRVVLLKVPDSGCDLVDQVVIVGSNQHSTWITLQ